MAKTQTVTILFCDLVASTERRARLGDDAFDDFSARFMTVLRNSIAESGGREVSSAGDGMMVVFTESVADAVACATAMHRGVAPLDPRDPPLLRIGISSGEVAQDGSEFSGMPIVEAARLEAAAAPGRTLASAVVRSLIGTRRAFRFRDMGALTLKGLPIPLAAVEVVDDEVADLPTPTSTPTPTREPRRRRSRKPWIAAVGAFLIAVVAGAFVIASRGEDDTTVLQGVTAPDGYTPRLEPTACFDPAEAKELGATCSWLVVPQDRTNPGGKQIRAFVTRVPARTHGASADHMIDLCDCESIATTPTRDHSELIKIEPRGYGLGQPVLTCPEMHAASKAALARRTNDPGSIRAGRDALSECYQRLVADGIDPAQYNFDTAAQDVIDLMFALKIRRADFVSRDEQAVEAFGVLSRAPAAVRSLTLVNPAPPGTTAFTDPARDLADAFDHYIALCRDDRDCADAYPNLQTAYRDAYQRVKTTPIAVPHPDYHDPSAPAIPLLVDGPRAADGLALALNDNKTHASLAAGVLDPSGEAIVGAATGAQASPGFAIYPEAEWGAYASYICSYNIRTADPTVVALTARTLPQFVRAFYGLWDTWCPDAWPVPDLTETLSAEVSSSVPALLIRGDLSPDGNRDWVAEIQRDLPNAQTVVFRTLGGGLLTEAPACLNKLRLQFLADPTTALATTACAKQSPKIRFVVARS